MKKLISLHLTTVAAAFLFLCISCSHTKTQVSSLEGLSSESSSETSDSQVGQANQEATPSDKEAFLVPNSTEATPSDETAKKESTENTDDSASKEAAPEETSAFAVPAEKPAEAVASAPNVESTADVSAEVASQEPVSSPSVAEAPAVESAVPSGDTFALAKENTNSVKSEVVEKDIASLIATAEQQEGAGVQDKNNSAGSDMAPDSSQNNQERDIDSKHKKKWRKKRHHRRGKTAENVESDEMLNAYSDQEVENKPDTANVRNQAKLAYAEVSAFVGKNLFPLALVMVGTLVGTFFVIRRNRKSDHTL